MKTEIKLEELLKQITPLPWIPTGRAVYNKGGLEKGGQIAYTGDSPHAAYLTHCANVLPELVKALRRFEDYEKNGFSTVDESGLSPRNQVRQALAKAEKVTLP